MLSDIQIAQQARLLPIREIAAKAGINDDEVFNYGPHKAKIDWPRLRARLKDRPDGRLVLVTAINPTPAGEGKTTTTVGLGQALCREGKNAIIALREPSLGPVFGIKGGAAGGGYAQVVPMEDINLHFTGDIHAITAANNLCAAVIDNHLQQGNPLGIDPRRITWKRCLDMNDRALRNVVVGLGGKANGVPREDHFQISVASEIMAVFCLAEDLDDLKARLSRIIVAFTYDGAPVTAADLKVDGAMAALLKDALDPNLVQTLENTPALMHGGPFANIAHGCNSLIATRAGLKLADILVTEAGFGADLGAEKFLDIKCRIGGLSPDCVVLVATARSFKYNGGIDRAKLTEENIPALREGLVNLEKHIENLRRYGLPVVVAVNRFPTDTDAELSTIISRCAELGVRCAISTVFAEGGEGGRELAKAVLTELDGAKPTLRSLYELDLPLVKKIETIAREIYGAHDISLTSQAEKALETFTQMGYGDLPVCIAKTQYSLSDDPTKLGRPSGFTLTVRDATLSAGAGFVVCLTGDIMTMPGLPRIPSAESIGIDEEGHITGLF